MKRVRFSLRMACERCGHPEMWAEMSREKGHGAALLLACPSCGGETAVGATEIQAKKIDRLDPGE